MRQQATLLGRLLAARQLLTFVAQLLGRLASDRAALDGYYHFLMRKLVVILGAARFLGGQSHAFRFLRHSILITVFKPTIHDRLKLAIIAANFGQAHIDIQVVYVRA